MSDNISTKVIDMSQTKKNSKKESSKDTKKEIKETKREIRDSDSDTNSDTDSDTDDVQKTFDIDDMYKLIDLYFQQNGIMYAHHSSSIDKMFDEDIPRLLLESDNEFLRKITKTKIFVNRFEFKNVSIKPPMMDNDFDYMYPSDARDKNLTYSTKILASVSQMLDVIDIATGKKTTKLIGTQESDVPVIGTLMLVRGKYCNLNTRKDPEKIAKECEFDPGNYFIIKGNEKLIMPLERMIDNTICVYFKKDVSGDIYTGQVNSKSYEHEGKIQTTSIKYKKDKTMTLRAPMFNELPVFILIRALGLETDSSIVDYVVQDPSDEEMINEVLISIEKAKENKTGKIISQYDAYNYILSKLRPKKYSDVDEIVRSEQKKLHLNHVLDHDFLPHINGQIEKAYYLCFMVNRILQVSLGRIEPDDRDSFVNKRVETTGELIFQIIRQYYKKMLNECSKFFVSRNNDDYNPINIIDQIKAQTIEQGVTQAVMSGSWGSKNKKGVAQVLQRLSYLQTISALRRVNSPTDSTIKLTSPRHVHNTQWGYCLTGDTEILMDDGTIKLIKDIRISDALTTVNINDLKNEISGITKLYSRMPDELLEITTISGRTIKCTPEHPVLTKCGKGYFWKLAEHLTLDDKIIVKHMVKYIPIEKCTTHMIRSKDIPDEYRTYRQELALLGLVDRDIPHEKLMIIARLVGALNTDGHVGVNKSGYYESAFYVGEINDVCQLRADIQNLGFGTSYWRFRENEFYDKIKDVTILSNVYEVVKNGDFAYFMSLFGAFVGKKTTQKRELPEWLLNADKQIIREFLSAFQGGDGSRIAMYKETRSGNLRATLGRTLQTTNKANLKHTIKYMNSISKLFEMFDIDTTITNRYEEKDDVYQVHLNISNRPENIIRYADYIKYTYCADKERESAIVIEYLKTKLERDCDLDFKQFKKDNLEQCEKVSIRIKSIKNIKPQKVFDITTSSANHNFIGNGLVLHNCCAIESPEGSKIGLVKNLAVMCTITNTLYSQIPIIKEIIAGFIRRLTDVIPFEIKRLTKVYLNGTPEGITKKPVELVKMLREARINSIIDKFTSICYNVETKEIKIYCDGGRFIRPLLRVNNNNELYLKREHIDSISLEHPGNGSSPISLGLQKQVEHGKITTWNDFIMKYPEVIDFVDVQESDVSMISMYPDDLVDEKKIMNRYIKTEDKKRAKLNRYDGLIFRRFTHCEIHPSMMLGVVVSNTVFLQCNQSPRNIYQYSYARQAMGVYISNYRDRMDISYVLYHPQVPLVGTRMRKHTNADKLPAGENVMVAIMSFTGWT